MVSSLINVIAVFSFAICMLMGQTIGSYVSSMLIAFSFIPMACAYVYRSKEQVRVAAYVGLCFAIIYVTVILLVYFAQVTTVRDGGLSSSALQLLDFQQFGLFFNYDLLGYALLSLSTFFIGLSISVTSRIDQWLKWLLLIHGLFALPCLILPMLNLYSTTMQGADWIGVMILEFWCFYFIPVDCLSCLHIYKNA